MRFCAAISDNWLRNYRKLESSNHVRIRKCGRVIDDDLIGDSKGLELLWECQFRNDLEHGDAVAEALNSIRWINDDDIRVPASVVQELGFPAFTVKFVEDNIKGALIRE